LNLSAFIILLENIDSPPLILVFILFVSFLINTLYFIKHLDLYKNWPETMETSYILPPLPLHKNSFPWYLTSCIGATCASPVHPSIPIPQTLANTDLFAMYKFYIL
jgi:hypothetical protein